MYSLEIILVNSKENLFFEDEHTDDTSDNIQQIYPVFKKYHDLGCFVQPTIKELIRTRKRSKVDSGPYQGAWTSTLTLSYFKTVDAVASFYKDFMELDAPYRHARRAWAQKHDILTEANAIDQQGNLVQVITSCVGHVCARFGTCNDSKCSVIPTKIDDFAYPVFHLRPA